MPLIKTATLMPPALDWAVAKIDQQQWDDYDCLLWVQDDEYRYSPSTDGLLGVRLIEANTIGLEWGPRRREMEWLAWLPKSESYGPTPLIAAMRCLVASKFGDVIDIPEELL